MMTGFLGGMMSAFIEPIRNGLQESVRKVTVRVIWDETGRADQTIEVVQYLTDPSQLEKARAGGRRPGAPGAARRAAEPPAGRAEPAARGVRPIRSRSATASRR